MVSCAKSVFHKRPTPERHRLSGLWRRRRGRTAAIALLCGAVGGAALIEVETTAAESTQAPAALISTPALREALDEYCIACHNERLRTADLALDTVDASHPETDPELWERVVAKLRAGSMPPPRRPRPDAATYNVLATALEEALDEGWARAPRSGRGSAVHRINRTEYGNAVRDLFALDIDVTELLPGDETADGSFDNFADVLTISRSQLERYLSVARQVTRLAVGLVPPSPGFDTFEIPLHVVQDARQSEDLPLGSRGGMAIPYQFPVDGEYMLKVRLRRQYQRYLMGMGWAQQLEVRLDGKLVGRFTVGGNATGTPAAASYAGDGEPGFAADADWETFIAADRRRRPGSASAGRGWSAHRWRVVCPRTVGAGGLAAAVAARPRADERPDLHGIRRGRRGRHWWPLYPFGCDHGDSQPAGDLQLSPPDPCRHGRCR